MASLCNILSIFNNINSIENKTLENLKLDLINTGHQNLSFKEDLENDLILIHHNKFGKSNIQLTDLENQCRNLILTTNLEPLCYHYNEIIYNPINLSDIDFKNAIIQESIEGTTILCFNHNDKWFVSTRRCIDASKSMWIPKYSYKQLLDDILCSKLENPTDEDRQSKIDKFFNILDKSLCYFFVLLHPDNKNIVNINMDDKSLVHFMTRKKGSIEEVDVNNSLYEFENGLIKKSPEYKNYDEQKIVDLLDQMNIENEDNKGITREGLVIRYYNKDRTCDVLKLQTSKYKKVKDIKPNNNNEQHSYLELFKNNNLSEYLELCTRKTVQNKGKIIKRLSEVFINLSTELLILYFKTRDKQNKETYENLTKDYKDVLYKIHGIYKKKCEENKTEEKVKVTRNDVYKLLKDTISTREIISLLINRKKLLDNKVNIFARNNQSMILTTKLLSPQVESV
jgi:hypothetical protein